ncbi:hypothetical protein ACVPOW_15185 [Staphylococcus aureus]
MENGAEVKKIAKYVGRI